MPGIAKDVIVHSPPKRIPLDVTLGTCAIALTSSPFIYPPPGALCYAILGDWLPTDEPVGMLITFRNYTPQGRAKPAHEIHSVFAGDAMTGHPDTLGRTIPVVIGRWLFEGGYLTLHSPDRTERGDRWARAVGGELPERDQQGTDENAVLSGREPSTSSTSKLGTQRPGRTWGSGSETAPERGVRPAGLGAETYGQRAKSTWARSSA